jgi:hypothetical protein
MSNSIIPGKLSLHQRLFFKSFLLTPSGFVAEPFEVFLVVFGLLSSAALILQHIQHLDQLSLPYYHGAVGLFIWSGLLLFASVILIWSLATMAQHNLLAIRKLEITGLWLYAALFSYYCYATLAVGLSLPEPAIYPILSSIAVMVLILACVIRAISLASSITTLAIARVSRVKQIKEQLRDALKESGKS